MKIFVVKVRIFVTLHSYAAQMLPTKNLPLFSLSLATSLDRWGLTDHHYQKKKKIFKVISYHLFNKTIFVYVKMSSEVKVWDNSLLHKLGREINTSKPIRRSWVYPVNKCGTRFVRLYEY